MKPSVLAVCFFTSPGPVPDNFHTLCRSLAGQSRLSVLTSDLIRDRDIPGVEAAEYVNVSKRQVARWFSPSLWLQVRRFVRRTSFDLLFLYSVQLGEEFHRDSSVTDLRKSGHDVSIEKVSYEFQRGGNQMLRIRTRASSLAQP